ncbi:cytochrome P450 [Agromyces tropicus]|uniref:Cytochrome P450 n=1 Tax=Agromyces tropicus TaxID=555371 RepID=A0ABP5FK37_9MICO
MTLAPDLIPVDLGDEYLPWTDPQFCLDPYPWYARLREENRVHLMADGTYVLSHYEDVLGVATSHDMSVVPGWDEAGPWKVNRDTIIGQDVPEHTRLKRQTNKWFTPKLVRQWVETTREQIGLALDRIGDDGLVDGWIDIAVRPTHVTMARVLGLPEDAAEDVAKAMAETMPMLAAGHTPRDVDRAAAGFAWLGEHIDEMLEARSAQPQRHLADALLAAVDTGDMTPTQARATIMLFYGLGHLDVGYLIVSGLQQFTRIPGLFQAYKNDPSVRKAIINEMVRMDPPELSIFRTPTVDVEVGGVTIPAGSTIRCLLGSANRDASVFEHPDEFDYTRPPQASMNLSFGAGVHHCAGQVISRAEVEVIFDAIADRFDSIEATGEPVLDHNDFARAFHTLPLRLS